MKDLAIDQATYQIQNSITCNTCGSTNKSPTKLNAAENKFDKVIYL